MLLVLKQVHPEASISNKARAIFHHAYGSVDKKVRKETYSSYIYQGGSFIILYWGITNCFQSPNRSIPILVSPAKRERFLNRSIPILVSPTKRRQFSNRSIPILSASRHQSYLIQRFLRRPTFTTWSWYSDSDLPRHSDLCLVSPTKRQRFFTYSLMNHPVSYALIYLFISDMFFMFVELAA